jgi:hypothetical protein
MNCTELSDLFGVECAPLETLRGGKAMFVGTPFLFADGEPVPLYVETDGDRIRFFDNGDVLFHMAAMGLDVSDRRRWGPFRTIAAKYGVALRDDGEFETWEHSANAPAGFARFLSTLLATAEWERENIGLPADAHLLIDEAELYLRAWKPKAPFEKAVSVGSFTGKTYDFDFRIDNELIDVISASPTATGSELRKLLDVRRVSENAEIEIRVVIDDRRDAKRADNEAKIISGLATAWPMSKLIASVGSANA